MKTAKKVLSLLLACVLAFGVFAVGVYAEGEKDFKITLSVDNATPKPGDFITVSVYYTTNFYAAFSGAMICFDGTVFEAIGEVDDLGRHSAVTFTPATGNAPPNGNYLDGKDIATAQLFSALMAVSSYKKAYFPTGWETLPQNVNMNGFKLTLAHDQYKHKYAYVLDNEKIAEIKLKVISTITEDISSYIYVDPSLAKSDTLKNGAMYMSSYSSAVLDDNTTRDSAYANFTNDFTEANVQISVKAEDDPTPELVYTALEAAIDTKPTYVAQGATYYGDTWAAYATALAAAEALYAAQDAETQEEIDAVEAALTTAYGKLTLLGADYTTLDAAILDKPDYYDEGEEYYDAWEAYETALANAVAVSRTLKINDQGIINAATTALTTARGALELLDADYTKLDAAILDKPTYYDKGATYYGDTWAAYDTALKAALAVDRTLKVNDQGIINAATTALTTAQDKLVLLNADYTALDAAILDKPEDYENGATVYTQATWDAYTAALEAALAVDRDLKINDQGIIDTAEATLVAAKAALEKNPVAALVYTGLKAEIDNVPALLEGKYTKNSWDAYKAVLDRAVALYEEQNAETQDEIDLLTNELKEIKEKLVLAADKTALLEAIELFEALVPDDWTAASYLDAEDYYESALSVYNNKNIPATNQFVVDNAEADLREAIENLVPKTPVIVISYVNLGLAIDDKPTYFDEGAAYYGTTWAAYAAALADAEELYAKRNAKTQAEVDAVETALKTAQGALTLLGADYTALAAALALTPEFSQDKYTVSSWDAYDAARTAALNVPGDLKINDQSIIDTAAANLVTAFNNLKLVTQVGAIEYVKYTKLPLNATSFANNYEVKVMGRPSKIQFIESNGATRTYDRYNTNVTSVQGYKADGTACNTLDLDLAYEIWVINATYAPAGYNNADITAIAKYTAWEDLSLGYQFKIEFSDAQYGDTYVNATMTPTTCVYGTVATVTVTTSNNIGKIQLVEPNGGTRTFSADNAAVCAVSGNELVWTVSYTVYTIGEGQTMNVRAKIGNAVWAEESAEITFTVTAK